MNAGHHWKWEVPELSLNPRRMSLSIRQLVDQPTAGWVGWVEGGTEKQGQGQPPMTEEKCLPTETTTELFTNNIMTPGECWDSALTTHSGNANAQILNKVSKIKLKHKIAPNYVFWAPYLVDAGALIIITLKQPFLKLNIFRLNSHSPLQLSFNNWLIIFVTPQQL